MRTTGDPRQGAALIREFGCGSCHTIPGIRSARGVVGPPLDFFSRRTYITGRLPNSEQNLVLWILNPQQVDPLTAMPPVGASEKQARHIAAYLYTLE
ncbi:c-type cytochrome [Gilvimarinus sp. F26214L]|uniref:c-type cytochrome n=1 Tax=Gilvimarinus sp. DZF01 TaxID=3461371 RepID=UPI0040463596